MKTITKDDFLVSLPFTSEGRKPVEHQSVFETLSQPITEYCEKNTLGLETDILVADSKHTLSEAEVMELPVDEVSKKSIIPMDKFVHRKAIVSYRISDRLIQASELDFMVLYIMDLTTGKLTLAQGTSVKVCSNGNILGASDIRTKSGSQPWNRIMDPLEVWLNKRQETMQNHFDFKEKMESVYLEGQSYADVFYELYKNSILGESKLVELGILNKCLRECENEHNQYFKTEYVDNSPHSTLWNIYNNMTESLKTENTVKDRAQKHCNTSIVFKNLANKQAGKELFAGKELLYYGHKQND